MPNIASRFPKEFHWNKTFLMDKVVPPTVKCLICPTGVEKKTFFPKFIEKTHFKTDTRVSLERFLCFWFKGFTLCSSFQTPVSTTHV